MASNEALARAQAKYLARLAAVPQAVQTAVRAQLEANANDLVAAIKRAAPVGNSLEGHAGELRESVHWYDVTGRPLTVRVIADARAPDGEFYATHVEAGHRTPDGGHVAAQPFFFPIYRSMKKPMRRAMNAAARAAIKNL